VRQRTQPNSRATPASIEFSPGRAGLPPGGPGGDNEGAGGIQWFLGFDARPSQARWLASSAQSTDGRLRRRPHQDLPSGLDALVASHQEQPSSLQGWTDEVGLERRERMTQRRVRHATRDAASRGPAGRGQLRAGSGKPATRPRSAQVKSVSRLQRRPPPLPRPPRACLHTPTRSQLVRGVPEPSHGVGAAIAARNTESSRGSTS